LKTFLFDFETTATYLLTYLLTIYHAIVMNFTGYCRLILELTFTGLELLLNIAVRDIVTPCAAGKQHYSVGYYSAELCCMLVSVLSEMFYSPIS